MEHITSSSEPSAFNEALEPYGLSIGLSNSKEHSGTWEWYEKVTGEYNAGYLSAADAYESAGEYIADQTGEQIPELDEDGEIKLVSRGSQPI